jgi:phosphohistidine phosphatase SixA
MIARIICIGAAVALLAPAAAAAPSVFLARHAEKAEGGADAKNPELSAAGRLRADRLAQMLRDAGVVAIFASEFTRTQQTAEQLARTTGAEVKVVSAKDARALIDALAAVDGNAVVIGHSNTLPEIIKALGVEKPITIADDEYDNLFIWNRSSPGELIRLRY